LVHGPEGEAFERDLAAYNGVAEAVVVSSGTAALHLALLAAGIGPGDAVVVPDFTFPATANVVRLCGAEPIFVDVEPGTYNMSAAAAEHALESYRGTARPRAIMPVHEFGCPADMPGLLEVARSHGMEVIEDAACAIGGHLGGKRLGSFGFAGCLSFHPRKVLTTGEGGAILTNDPEVAAHCRRLRAHGMVTGPNGWDFVEPGFNYRLTNFQSAIGRIQLRKLDAALAKRRELKRHYDIGLAGCDWFTPPANVDGHSWQTYMGLLAPSMDRDRLISLLKAEDIETNLGAQCVRAQTAYRHHPAPPEADWTALRLFRKGLALPLHEGLAIEDVARVIEALRRLAPLAR
jgi:dTDP-4-amino-4,6-dideoxygalactose transaminase